MMFEGQAPITGLSLIVTLNEHVELPQELLAVQVTDVVPVEKVEPDAGEQDTVGAGVPVAVGVLQVATWLSHWVILEGQLPITGLSLIVTLNEHVELPQELLAVQVTDVVPVEKVEPDAGEQDTVGAGVPVAVGVLQVATWLSHWVMLEGQLPITGLSLMVTLKEQLELPQVLVAVQVTV